MIAPTTHDPLRPGIALTRGAFLACSWTWCIGMYFPVFLIGDFGWPVWLVFAIPNIIGATLVGFIHRHTHAAHDFQHKHTHAVRWFSLITVLFHVVFLSWFLTWPVAALGLPVWASPIAVALLVTISWLLALGKTKLWCLLALALWSASLILFVLAGTMTDWMSIHAPLPMKPGMSDDLLWLAPVLIFGFLLCPHLDATILRTRHETTGRTGTAAFVVGFSILFPVMILGTLFYSWALNTQWGLSWYIIAHIAMQSVFTMGAHLRELRELGFVLPRMSDNSKRRTLNSLGFIALIALGLSVYNARATGHERFVYDLVLSMYGLTFPAYLWIIALPRSHPFRKPISVWMFAVGVASPMFWLGAINQQWIWLTPGVGVLLLTPLVAALVMPKKRIQG